MSATPAPQTHEEKVRESALILGWLYDNPIDRAWLLFLAENPKDDWTEEYEYAPVTKGQIDRLPSQRAAIASYLSQSLVGACDRCQCSTLELADGLVDWPLEPHVCRGPVAAKPLPAVRQERHTGAAL